MVEYWKVEDPVFSGIVFKRKYFINKLPCLYKRCQKIIPISHNPLFPSFHHSNWGEAPKFDLIGQSNVGQPISLSAYLLMV
jgi:hypothetical protein